MLSIFKKEIFVSFTDKYLSILNQKTLYLIPCHLSETPVPGILPPFLIDVILKTKYYFAEELRTSRRFISSLKLGIKIEGLQFYELNKKTTRIELKEILQSIPEDVEEIGVMSEAGCPGVADPGSKMVAIAHEQGWKVVPIPGPSSILLGLMGSGFNGQQFTFDGYLPINNEDRAKAMRKIEEDANNKGITHIFIETPFRNQIVLVELLKHLNPQTLLCLAINLTSETEIVQTKRVAVWKNNIPDIHKIPTIFLIGKFDTK